MLVSGGRGYRRERNNRGEADLDALIKGLRIGKEKEKREARKGEGGLGGP